MSDSACGGVVLLYCIHRLNFCPGLAGARRAVQGCPMEYKDSNEEVEETWIRHGFKGRTIGNLCQDMSPLLVGTKQFVLDAEGEQNIKNM
jgi:hypothetical protein